MNIIEMNVDDVIPYDKNPRFNDNAVDYVANSIKEFGFKVPIVLDENNIVVTGHTRLKAAKQLGIKTVPCVVADDLTPAQIKAFRLADNKVGEIAQWDNDLLNAELADLSFEMDMTDFGFAELSLEDEEDDEKPATFKEYGDDIETEHKCPKCGYEW